MLHFLIPHKFCVRVSIDIIEVDEICKLITENPAIVDTLFTSLEIAYCIAKRRNHEHLVVRLAAKKAVLKLLEKDVSDNILWTDIEIVNEITGKPCVYLYREVAAIARRQSLIDLNVSLSHTAGIAVALAVGTVG